MATNKNALIRYKTIDKCLQNTARRWTLDDLIEACSDALYEYEGKDSNVSKRTVQLDIQLMRSDKLGYNAPIEVYERKYYRYSEINYSINEIPLTDIDLDILTESMEMLRQFKDVSLFSELNGVIQKLEDKIYRESKDQSPIIHLDKNEDLIGLEHLDTLYQAILKKIVLNIEYQSFSARKPGNFGLCGYILKEFNNRWFVVGRRLDNGNLITLALDRIVSIEVDLEAEYSKKDFDASTYYDNTYGVTVMRENNIINIEMRVDAANAPYVVTKPFHHSQEVLGDYPDGSVLVGLRVHHNYEIERLIMGFGEAIEIIKPRKLRSRIRKKFEKGLENYSKA